MYGYGYGAAGYGAAGYGAGCCGPVAGYGVGSCVGAGIIAIAILILIALGVIF